MNGSARRGLALVLLVALVGCDGPQTTHCGFDLYCPTGTVCNEAHQRCVSPAQVAACEGLSDGDACTWGDDIEGTCNLGVCFAAECGNGVLDEGEACDDGNTVPKDGCSADCLSDETCGNVIVDYAVGEQCDCGDDAEALPTGCRAPNGDPESQCSATCRFRYCSNGVVDPGEACDDGNLVSGDGCSADCRSNETCGNGLVDFAVGEVCDDGNTELGDGCGLTCRGEVCGNGVVDAGESCDDGNFDSGDGCRGDCLSNETCGNGVPDLTAGELCDCGADATALPTGCQAVNGDPDGRCSATCQSRYCGNGIVDPWEVCDDGNSQTGDGCTPDCMSDESCGNGRLDYAAGETCDCGTDPTGLPRGCTAVNGAVGGECSDTCQSVYCGNGTVDAQEVCDDGNLVSGDGCSADCVSDETCGNGIADFPAGELCDCGTDPADLPPGCTAVNGDPQGGCSASCQSLYCGNGTVDPGEVCDDGNTASGDGCSADCRSDESCGNGYPDFAVGESCDDGNATAGDGCSATCRFETCGNGIQDVGEVCDDGNNTSGDGCRADCLSDETCGNGLPDLAAGETCDDGNTTPGDGCGVTCQLEVCGNGVMDPGELCDDGNQVGGDGCSADCISDETCGNGLLDVVAGETCDDGNNVSGDGCSSSCRLELCGNGLLDVGEVCDDGNNLSGDGCSGTCISDETCGNGVVDVAVGESCDDGNTLPGDGCSPTCLLEQCGNGALELGEACDDGNNLSGDGCSADCLSAEVCGNGYVDVLAGETCDDGNTASGDGCNGSCLLEQCGNGVIDLGEACDDGNNVSGDGCRADCLSDETCGNGIIDFARGEQCDDGNTVSGDGCSSTCRFEGCGNGLLDGGEVCDDGNNVSGDGCRGDCLSDETCGNGILDGYLGETCDDGNTTPGDGCGATCLLEYCGNGVVDASEVCDDGNNTGGDGCRGDCRSDETCGNGLLDAAAGETCDDGGTAPGDGCGPTCLTEYCGNGVVDPGEVCDDGNNVGGDGCSSGCTSVEICGDGVLDPAAGEECDDGNTDRCDGCSPTCQVETSCPLGQTCCAWASGCIPEDESNCGECGFTCNAGVYCRNGTCVEPGVIVITEFNPDPGPIPDADGEFMELYNTTSMPVNLLGWVIHDDKGSNLPKTIDQSVVVEPGGFAVLARNTDPSSNGGFTADWGWWDEVTQFAYSNAEILYLEASVDTGSGTTVIVVDSVDYDNAWWASGYSTSLDPSAFDHLANDDPANWCLTSTSHPLPNEPNAYATPGEMNDPCP